VIHCLKLLTLSNRSNELVAFPSFCLETETDQFSKYFALFRESTVSRNPVHQMNQENILESLFLHTQKGTEQKLDLFTLFMKSSCYVP